MTEDGSVTPSAERSHQLRSWIKWDAIAWKRLTEPLSIEHEVVLLRMLAEIVERDGAFPADLDLARRFLRIGATRKTARVLKELVDSGLLTLTGEGYTFEFAARALEDRRSFIAKQSANARKNREKAPPNNSKNSQENNELPAAVAEVENQNHHHHHHHENRIKNRKSTYVVSRTPIEPA